MSVCDAKQSSSGCTNSFHFRFSLLSELEPHQPIEWGLSFWRISELKKNDSIRTKFFLRRFSYYIYFLKESAYKKKSKSIILLARSVTDCCGGPAKQNFQLPSCRPIQRHEVNIAVSSVSQFGKGPPKGLIQACPHQPVMQETGVCQPEG